MIGTTRNVEINLGNVTLKGILSVPENSKGIIIFSHGSGSSRLSPRNNFVAKLLNEQQFATLLFDLLTEKEDRVYENRFDIELLTQRLINVTKWVKNNFESSSINNIGYFGASTGSASALKAAAFFGDSIKGVVSRGGRTDLAGNEDLNKINSPTLFIVGGFDDVVIALNRIAYSKLKCEKDFKIVSNASHLFEEPGKLEEVTALTISWFNEFFND
ncbi:alpha/beta hydrolase family protein [Tenacibaculum adriaticum]|uniref:Alpha/beta hydrolase family protein n=1 Tax=Tenacibaculum adriaticum TaxID=413713 RepID=A0A5S5DVR8_9FLAO|nr:alpha/beta hydrolase [Tenacibaculum adriaticum]TYQ00081.1 alpha/beta hydrolase family protein [Tenacibaculum adriaticum]